jgi:hypothetical protein
MPPPPRTDAGYITGYIIYVWMDGTRGIDKTRVMIGDALIDRTARVY